MRLKPRLLGRLSKRAVAGAAALVVLFTSLLLVGAQPASAAPGGQSLRLVKSQCMQRNADGKPTFQWWGAGPTNGTKAMVQKARVRGTMFVCVYKFRFADNDKKFDYWGASVQSYWARNGGSANYPAKALHQIGSTRTAQKAVFDGTESYTSKKSCGAEVSLGVQIGIFSASAPVQACKSYKLEATRVSDAAGSWRIQKIGGWRKVETVYSQMVPRGKVPTFYVGVTVPRYNLVWQDIPGLWRSVPNFTSVSAKL
ncbi:hypothetical protein [Cryptosporangium aurantiacum]|uniref:Uncharacterized protein n=1 Tax=Cryptosporangium aurantiacum TaxID=134849 RepID=A0A1M7RK22_9ACTN|nr:hypothetical protein [Cryptosporangium aurantiacum]SHN46496.1 hypothetical protein SAMN05443668_11632 [Cryptosporangium aurantiacum]